MQATATEAKGRIDKDELKRLARGRWPEILSRLGGIDEQLLDGQHHPCPRCQGHDRFSLVDRDAGAVLCRGCFCKKNGDGLAALGWANGWGFGETCKRLAEYLGVTNGNGDHRSNGKPKEVFPTSDAALVAYDQRIDGERVGQWTYHDANGEPLVVVARWNLPDGGKTIRPTSRQAGVWVHGDRDVPKPWPLYGVPNWGESDLVLFVEGETCCDAAASIGLAATTTLHGAQSPQHADFAPLAGKEIWILPDNDEAGLKYASEVTERLLQLKPRPKVKRLTLPDLPLKGDIVDWLDAHDAAEPEILVEQIQHLADETDVEGALPIVSCADVADRPARLRTPILHQLQRQGEVLNIIAPSKTGKSWLGIGIGLSVASGTTWLDRYHVYQGPVLYIDNELHPETFQHRVETVSGAMGLRMRDLPEFSWWNLRGKLCDLHGLAQKLEAVEPEAYRVIVLDAWYRFLPPGVDENDNGAVTQLYNVLDSMAERLKCGFICVHHSSKGNQSGKAVTDVGSGAGSQSRACDTHLVLRAHEEDGAYVLDAAVRSFPPIEPIGCRFNFPLWSIDEELDPTKLRPEKRRGKKEAAAAETPVVDIWTPERFVSEFVTSEPRPKASILVKAVGAGLSKSFSGDLLKTAESDELVHRWTYGPRKPVEFATTAQPSVIPDP